MFKKKNVLKKEKRKFPFIFLWISKLKLITILAITLSAGKDGRHLFSLAVI